MTLDILNTGSSIAMAMVPMIPPRTVIIKSSMGAITLLKENAGVFCHNNPWIMIAETIVGNGDRAFEYYKKIAPSYLEKISDLHKTEPYVYAQMIAGKDAYKPGETKNSWLTGTAAWNYYAITQYILGIRSEYDGLLIDLCIPSDWDTFTVQRKFRNAHYKITVQNLEHVSKGIKEILVEDAKRVLRYYIRRWECEEAIRFLKSQVNLEMIRTFRWTAIRRLVLLAVLVMIYLGWIVEGYPDIGDRLVYLSQPLPDKPDFLVYRLLRGLTEAINTCFWLHKDLLRRSLW